jgi:hypothetical protein
VKFYERGHHGTSFNPSENESLHAKARDQKRLVPRPSAIPASINTTSSTSSSTTIVGSVARNSTPTTTTTTTTTTTSTPTKSPRPPKLKPAIMATIIETHKKVPDITPTQLLQTVAIEHPSDFMALDVNQVKNALKYLKKKDNKRKRTDHEGNLLDERELVYTLLSCYETELGLKRLDQMGGVPWCRRSEYIKILPELAKSMPQDKIEIAFSHPALLKKLVDDGSIVVGMDGMWKLLTFEVEGTTKRMTLIYVNAVDSNTMNSFPGAFFLTSSGDAQAIHKFILALKELIAKLMGKDWNPTFMMDKDTTERKAIQDLGLKIALCKWHNNRTLKGAIARFPQEYRAELQKLVEAIVDSATQEIFKMNCEQLKSYCLHPDRKAKVEAFWHYINDNWLCPQWKDTFASFARHGTGGLWETNNYSEALFRVTLSTFFGRRKCKNISTFLFVMWDRLMPYYIKRLADGERGIIPYDSSNDSLAALRKRRSDGFDIFEAKNIFPTELPHLLLIRSTDGTQDYYVNMIDKICTCLYFLRNQKACKHIFGGMFFLKMMDSALFRQVRQRLQAARVGAQKKTEKAARYGSSTSTQKKSAEIDSESEPEMDSQDEAAAVYANLGGDESDNSRIEEDERDDIRDAAASQYANLEDSEDDLEDQFKHLPARVIPAPSEARRVFSFF